MQVHIDKKTVLLIFGMLGTLFWWFELRPLKIRQECYSKQLETVEKRHNENLNYYFVWTGGDVLEELDKVQDAGRNKPMYVKDLNARLDEYWADVAYKDCLRENGLEE